MKFWSVFPLIMLLLTPAWLAYVDSGVAEGGVGMPPNYAEGGVGMPPSYAEGGVGMPPD